MEITLGELVSINGYVDDKGIYRPGSLDKLLTQELPIKTAYRLGRLASKVQSELKQYNLIRDNLIKKYGKEVDGQFTIPKEDKKAIENFIKENGELLSTEVKIDFTPVTIDELGGISISPIDIGSLEKFIAGENEEKLKEKKLKKVV